MATSVAEGGPVAILTAIPEELAGIRRSVSESGRLVLVSPRGGRLSEAVVLRTDTLLIERVGLYENRNGKLVRLPLEVQYEQYAEYEGRLLPRRLLQPGILLEHAGPTLARAGGMRLRGCRGHAQGR